MYKPLYSHEKLKKKNFYFSLSKIILKKQGNKQHPLMRTENVGNEQPNLNLLFIIFHKH